MTLQKSGQRRKTRLKVPREAKAVVLEEGVEEVAGGEEEEIKNIQPETDISPNLMFNYNFFFHSNVWLYN